MDSCCFYSLGGAIRPVLARFTVYADSLRGLRPSESMQQPLTLHSPPLPGFHGESGLCTRVSDGVPLRRPVCKRNRSAHGLCGCVRPAHRDSRVNNVYASGGGLRYKLLVPNTSMRHVFGCFQDAIRIAQSARGPLRAFEFLLSALRVGPVGAELFRVGSRVQGQDVGLCEGIWLV